ncbi:MAG: hypothetical protein C0501_10495 [Isosphaera sp.]|nr:hypothetical protein [Isosphaera sp.]
MTRVDPRPHPADLSPAARRLTAAARAAWHPVARAWRRFLALTRLSPSAVCEMSAPLGRHDYHTHADDADRAPWGTVGGARCARCGKWYRL